MCFSSKLAQIIEFGHDIGNVTFVNIVRTALCFAARF